MTDHNEGAAPPLTIAGRPVAGYLRARVPSLTRRVVDRLRTELPVYAELPHEEVAGDIADIVQHNLRLFADVIEQHGHADDHRFAFQRESAAQRAEEGVPLDAILSAYHLGTELSWNEITEGARPADLADLQAALAHLMSFQRRLISEVTAAYLETREVLDVQQHHDRHSLMTALLAGDPPDHPAYPAGTRPAPLYVVMTLTLDRHPDEGRPGPRARVAARRKIRRVQSTFDRFAGEPALTALDAFGGTALLPADSPPAWDDLRELITRTARSADVPVTAAAAVAEPAGVPDAVAQNTEIVDLVARTGRAPGLYRLADVLLDYQLSRPGEALTALACLLRPLEPKPELLQTLETYLRQDLDRRRTATALHVHPNTVDYRIRRITQLIGLSPARPADLPRINAALVARRSVGPAQ
ncbi:helix-turn-helix domain-containing protein [Actinomadura sp. DC4]|uniref:PucR family transcriptional regulator n=1 Tax=Actinomadura sp. DC4 TaxID=3055069 RepID=UPI0025B069AF|nr:helix-turn-helix domain-containing protein [Actinomadura sp. DC4]MDN3356390.1 helix-turn-helix domain-containing protein [Actinomadura sp. DC4]